MNELKCPKCNDVKLKKHEIEGTVVEFCEGCNGIWLDKGELNKVTHPIDGDIEFCSHEYSGEKSVSELSCPKCIDKKLKKANFIEFSDIAIDYCDGCNGIWLDKGELDAINSEIDALKEIPESWDHRVMVFLSKLPF